jgi:hypothetical protein
VSRNDRLNDLYGSTGVGGGRNSSIGIATCYGLDRPGGGEQDFP